MKRRFDLQSRLTLPRALAQAFNTPTFPIIAPDELVRLGEIELHRLRIPFQRRLRKARRHASKQHRLSQRSGVGEIRSGLTASLTSLQKLFPMIRAGHLGELKVFELRIGIKQWTGPMRQDDQTLGSHKNRAGVRSFVALE